MFKGFKHSEESKEKMRQAKIGCTLPDEHKKKIGLASKRIGISPETRAKMVANRKARGNYVMSDEQRQKLCVARRNRIYKDETREKIHQSLLGQKRALGHRHTKEMLEHLSEVHKELWKDDEYASRVFKGMQKSLNQRPNGCETIIAGMLEEIQPDTWMYVGDRSLKIGRKNPDFWNGGGKLVEHFGDYWHVDKVRCYEETEKGRIEFFEKRGYKVLIIWEHDLKKHPDIVREKIKEFVNNKNLLLTK